MFRNSTKSSPPGTMGGACRTASNLTQCIEDPKVGPLVCQGGKCVPVGMPGPVIPGPSPPPSPPPPGTMGGACRTASNLTQCIEDPKVGPLVCQAGKCVPVGIMPGPVRPTPSGPGPSPSGPTPGKKPAPGSYGMPCKQLSENMSTCNKGLTCVPGVPSPVCMPTPPGPSGPATKSGMGSKEILTIIGLIFLGLCFLCGLAKMGMKDAKRKSNCDKACGTFVFLGVALIAVSSVLKSSN